MSWTNAQALAITRRGTDLLVSASAGSGKTSVLIERTLRSIVDEGIDVDRLLILTYTKKAAGELRERLAAALERAYAEQPTPHLARQLQLLPQAFIGTLDGFCARLVRGAAERLGLDPDHRILPAETAELLKADVLDAELESLYAEALSGGFAQLLDEYGSLGGDPDASLRQLVVALYDYAQTQPEPDAWLEQAARGYTLAEAALPGSPWCRVLLDEARSRLEEAQAALLRAKAYAEAPGGPAGYLRAWAGDTAILSDLEAACAGGWDALANALGAVGRWPTAAWKDGDDEWLEAAARRARDNGKKIVADLAAGPWAESIVVHAERIARLAPAATALIELFRRLVSSRASAKRRRSALDFADLERYALIALRDPKSDWNLPNTLALDWQRRIDMVMVDEYQDINPLQHALIELLARPPEHEGGGNRFMVGDVKQSIYRFRLAEPEIFLNVDAAFEPLREPAAPPQELHRDPDDETHAGRALRLAENFRSRPEVIAAVNQLFAAAMQPPLAQMAYDERAHLLAAADYPAGESSALGGPVELHLIERQAFAEGPEDELPLDATGVSPDELEAIQREALVAAERLRALMAEGRRVWDAKAQAYRPLGWGDCAILLRAKKAKSTMVREVLAAQGIPGVAEGDVGFFERIEVGLVFSILRSVDNPRRDIDLAAVLRSPFWGFDEADLARLRLAEPHGCFYEALRRAAGGAAGSAGSAGAPGGAAGGSAGGPNAATESGAAGTPSGIKADLTDRAALALAQLDEWRTRARSQSVGDFVQWLYDEMQIPLFAAGLPDGRQRLANINAVLAQARQFDEDGGQGLGDFLQIAERLQAGEAQLGVRGPAGEADAVQILTIHGAKGLEYPVVIVLDLGKRFNDADATGDAIYDRALGIGLRRVDLEHGVKRASLPHEAVRCALRRQGAAEEQRVLYVALTRARERLILVGSAAKLADRAVNWTEGVPPERARSFLDWIAPVVARHPEGEPLRRAANVSDSTSGVNADGARWAVRLWTPQEAQSVQRSEAAATVEAEANGPDPAAVEAMVQRLIWRYTPDTAPAKLTVSEVRERLADDETASWPHERAGEAPLLLPRFMRPDSLTGAERGRAVHAVLESLPLGVPPSDVRSWDGPPAVATIRAHVQALVGARRLSPDEARSVDPKRIARFLRGELGHRLQQAAARGETILRELPFTLRLPWRELGGESETPVLVQGVIDCLFAEGDAWVLIDYKTDHIDAADASARTRHHAPQVRLYALAAERLLGRPVKEAWVSFLQPGIEARVE